MKKINSVTMKKIKLVRQRHEIKIPSTLYSVNVVYWCLILISLLFMIFLRAIILGIFEGSTKFRIIIEK